MGTLLLINNSLMAYIFGDFTNEVVDSVTTEATYGFTNVKIIIFILLVFVTCSITFFIYLLYKYFHCFSGTQYHKYENVPEQDRRWYLLAGEVLKRAECVIGSRARDIARLTPDVKIDEKGIFETLGPVPYVGMVAVVQRLYSHGGILVVPKELRGSALVGLNSRDKN